MRCGVWLAAAALLLVAMWTDVAAAKKKKVKTTFKALSYDNVQLRTQTVHLAVVVRPVVGAAGACTFASLTLARYRAR